MPERLLTTAEAAEVLRTPAATLRYWRHARIGPPSARLGRRVIYRESDITRWIEEQFTAQERT